MTITLGLHEHRGKQRKGARVSLINQFLGYNMLNHLMWLTKSYSYKNYHNWKKAYCPKYYHLVECKVRRNISHILVQCLFYCEEILTTTRLLRSRYQRWKQTPSGKTRLYAGFTIPRWPFVSGSGGMTVFTKSGGKPVDSKQIS